VNSERQDNFSEQTALDADNFNLRKWKTTFSTSQEEIDPITLPSRRTERTSGGPAWTSFGSEGFIPSRTKISIIDSLILKKSFMTPCASKYEVIPTIGDDKNQPRD